MPVTTKRGGIEIDGLLAASRALSKMSTEFKTESKALMKDIAVDVQKRSQARIGRAGRYPTTKGMIGRSVASGGAAVKLRASKYQWALGAEFGEVVASVPQRYGPSIERRQSRFKQRTMPQFKPPTSSDMFKNRGGYMIQPTIRARQKWIMNKLDNEFVDLIDTTLRKAGVPNG